MKKIEEMTQEELVAEVKNLRSRKKYGLVWEDKPEDVLVKCQTSLPVLVDVDKKSIYKNPDSSKTNLIIEGDNYHSLSVLNYTHQNKVDVIYADPPYNTGAKDWKYNNRFVDDNDTYRHSKWISMMEKRLLLAKKLLKPDGVLIITIDDYEVQNITKLLEDLNAKNLGRVSICIKPEGRRQSKYIMQAHEYALFVSWGNPVTRGLNVDFGLDFPEEDSVSKFRWEGLMRRDAGREDRGSDYWYPMYISPDGDIHFEKKKGLIELYPINTKGIERVWLWDKKRAAENVSELKAVVRNGKPTVYYKRRELGRVKPTSFWYGSKYNANAYGTRLLAKILPDTNFDFPKSLYSVIDCIDMFLPKDGLCLDYFAGSGTTGHAVLELNKSDGGDRKFILCTNNESKIAEEVTYPRIKAVINGYADQTGIPANLRYFKTDFVDKNKVSDDTRRELVERATEMICVKEDTFTKKYDNKKYKIYENSGYVSAILYDLDSIDDFKEKLEGLGKKASIYVFSLSNETFPSDFNDLSIKYKLTPIPESILEVYRKLFG
ncbi:site-specific DNA-methyltransferase [Candidatus Nomurabacteria bacterium]|nr:site-specific DNA-methyltransferase [Candidatus Nomurabacteria bacterium]MCB9826663.1 site-specific DNA-methyltransferase [Candidatus Nomurabacteria bacterium]